MSSGPELLEFPYKRCNSHSKDLLNAYYVPRTMRQALFGDVRMGTSFYLQTVQTSEEEFCKQASEERTGTDKYMERNHVSS